MQFERFKSTSRSLAAARIAAVGFAIFRPDATSKVCFAPGSNTARSEKIMSIVSGCYINTGKFFEELCVKYLKSN